MSVQMGGFVHSGAVAYAFQLILVVVLQGGVLSVLELILSVIVIVIVIGSFL